MDTYVIGIDGGSSKSHLALFDSEAVLKDFQHWGPLNHEVLEGSFAQFEQELGQFLSNALRANKITPEQVAYSVIGMAGVDTREQHSVVSSIITKLGLKDFTLCNDAYLGISAASPTGIGICAINGSGCTIAGINAAGEMLQIGGMGVITGDMGGGSMIGDRVVGAVYSALFRLGTPTLLTKLLFEKLGIENKYELTEKLSKMESEGISISSCNRLAFEAARQNDGVAVGIMQEIAASYASGISCMINDMGFKASEPLHIALAGSVFVKAEHPMAVEMIKSRLNAAYPDYKITYTLLNEPPVAGAVIWALKSLHGGGDYLKKVCTQLRK